MKISNTRKINEKITQYYERERLNQAIGLLLSGPISMDEIVFDDYSGLKRYADDFSHNVQYEGKHYSMDEAIIAVMVNSIISDTLGSAYSGAIPDYLMNEILKESKVFHEGDFDKNAYLQNIKFDDQKCGNFELSHGSYSRYEIMMYSTPVSKYNGIMIPRIGTFDRKFEYPSIKESGHTWMSVTPNEIFTMEKAIDEANGRILTLGLGMGYYAYMVSEKEEVEHITIVEKESDVIQLFNEFILPQFRHKDKITIIQADAFEFMNQLDDGEYDYCFADIWIGNNDTVPYLKLKQICKRFVDMKMSYWIEDSLISTIIGLVYMIILKEFYINNNIPAPELMEMPADEKYKIEYLSELLSDEEISRPEHVDYYLNYQNIIKLMS